MQYIGIDPSFSSTGVAYLDTDKKQIRLLRIQPEGTNVTYKDALVRSTLIALSVLSNIGDTLEAKLIIEEPLMTSLKASRLGLLSGVLAISLATIPLITEMYSVNPNYISSLNKAVIERKGLDKKKASSFVATEILSYLESLGFSVVIMSTKSTKTGKPKPRKMSHDEAEALILVIALLKKEGLIDNKFMMKLLSINKGFLKEANILQFKGEQK